MTFNITSLVITYKNAKFLPVNRTRRPATTGIFFAFPFWRRWLLKWWKRFFNKNTLYIISSIFSKFKNFLISRQKNLTNLTIKVEKTFLRNNSIWYAFCGKFANFSNLKKTKIFPKKTHPFFQKTQILRTLRNFTISIPFYGNYRLIAIIWWWKIFKVRKFPIRVRSRTLSIEWLKFLLKKLKHYHQKIQKWSFGIISVDAIEYQKKSENYMVQKLK